MITNKFHLIKDRKHKRKSIRRKRYRKKKQKEKELRIEYVRLNRVIKESILIRVPENFSIKDNTTKTIKFINDLKSLHKNRRKIYFSMSKVTNIDEGTIALFVSIIKELSIRKYKICGNKPKDKNAKRILERSGFFEHLNGEIDIENKHSPNTILTEGQSKTNQEVTARIIRNSIKFLTGEENNNQRLQRLFIELMANAINHGFKDSEKARWFLSSSQEISKSEKICRFAFIDNGQGIIDTLKLKSLFQEFLKNIKSFFNKDNQLLISAFKGEIGSRTKLDYRGKGLPTIYKTMEEKIISNLFVLTNNVILDFKDNKFYDISINHSGTFYYFELSNDNLNKKNE